MLANEKLTKQCQVFVFDEKDLEEEEEESEEESEEETRHDLIVDYDKSEMVAFLEGF